jgi:flagellar biosynthesis/type III secretory pathway chaperone
MTEDSSIASELSAMLAVERECCARLLPLLDAERAAAAGYDHAALLACLREREILQAEWLRAAARRREIQRTTSLTLATMPPELAALLRAVAREAGAVRRAQRVNEGIVRAALAQVTDLLSVMRRERPDSRYDGRAVLTGTAVSSAGGRWSA